MHLTDIYAKVYFLTGHSRDGLYYVLTSGFLDNYRCGMIFLQLYA
jgi:hypothetical protein